MRIIELETRIAAPRERCFDLARSVELHLASTARTGERVVAGRASGLCYAGDQITWRARHFGIVQNLSVEVTRIDYPHYFQDRMLRGAFRFFTHDHYFEAVEEGTRMRDVFTYAAPLGPLGRLAEGLFLDRHMRRLLEERNAFLKAAVEGDAWRTLLPGGF